MRDATEPIPIVGGVTKGVGNAPLAQAVGGKEEEKGYLSQAYDYAGGAARTVYDSAGNAVSPGLYRKVVLLLTVRPRADWDCKRKGWNVPIQQ